MKKVLCFVVNNSYDNARKIADYIIIALMKYDANARKNDKTKLRTYTSSVRRTVRDVIFGTVRDVIFGTVRDVIFGFGYDNPDDNKIRSYKITIYYVYGNRKSILSPSQNEIFNNIITVDNLSGILDKMDKSKDND